jgi:hypothetical protein
LDYTGVLLGGAIGLLGSLIGAYVSLRIARANLDASEARRHEELKREAYPRLVRAVDQLRDGIVTAVEAGGIDPKATIVSDPAWVEHLNEAILQVDLLGSQNVSTAGRSLMAGVRQLTDWVDRTGGVLGEEHPPAVSKEHIELTFILSGLNVRRHEFLMAARDDLGRPKIEFWEPREPLPSSLEEIENLPIEQPSSDEGAFAPRLHLAHRVWHRLPRRVQAWMGRTFRAPGIGPIEADRSIDYRWHRDAAGNWTHPDYEGDDPSPAEEDIDADTARKRVEAWEEEWRASHPQEVAAAEARNLARRQVAERRKRTSGRG